MSDPAGRITDSFNAQGLMTTLGAKLTRIEDGEVRIALAPRPEISQQHGYIHAGALTSILDTACGYAALTVAPVDADVLTVEFKANFLRPALGDGFVAVGKVVKAGKTITVCSGELFASREGREELIAIMQATIANVAPRAHRE